MRIHHLSCGSLCPQGGRFAGGEGGLLSAVDVVCHCLLIESSDGLVLVDTGFGTDDARNPAQLGRAFRTMLRPRPQVAEAAVTQVQRLGFAPADVRHIVVTHLDVDHAGGLPDFPGAEVHVFAPELAAALNPNLRDRSRYVHGVHWQHGPRWVEHRSEAGGDAWFGFESVRILPGIDAEVLLVPLLGHSRGHTGIALNTDERWLLHCGDAYFSHEQVATPPSCPPGQALFQRLLAADNGARTANSERLRELAASHGDEVSLFCSHDPHDLARQQAASAAGVA
ncbi:MAG TPA: MBL fold metallo-hydrolase [Solirubrobacterales bacterium]|nr:MBL fold metallo-hydrolase [Solirubrobacterales bacterium]